MSLKRIFVALACIVLLVCTFAFNTFAQTPAFKTYPIPFDMTTTDEYNPSGMYVNYDIYSSSGVIVYQKDAGAVAFDVNTNILVSDLPTSLISYDFSLYWDYPENFNPRQLVSFAYGSWASEGDSSLAYGLSGLTFSVDKESQGDYAILRVFRTTSFTLDYSEYFSGRIYMPGENLPIRLTLDIQSGVVDIYAPLNPSSAELGYFGSYSFNILANEPLGTFRYGLYDAVSDYPVSIVNATYNKFDDSYSEEIFTNGYNKGFSEGKEVGIIDGKSYGYSIGFNDGYDAGMLDGETSEIAVPEVISTIMNSTVTLFRNIFGFELFGINISALIGSLTLIVVVAWIIRKAVR